MTIDEEYFMEAGATSSFNLDALLEETTGAIAGDAYDFGGYGSSAADMAGGSMSSSTTAEPAPGTNIFSSAMKWFDSQDKQIKGSILTIGAGMAAGIGKALLTGDAEKAAQKVKQQQADNETRRIQNEELNAQWKRDTLAGSQISNTTFGDPMKQGLMQFKPAPYVPVSQRRSPQR